MKWVVFLGLALLLPAVSFATDFERQIRPLLRQHCVSCHGAKASKADLRLDAKSFALRGSESGPVIVPGKAADSPLYQRISSHEEGERMPPEGGLTPEQIAAIKQWIEAGAEWPESDEDRAAAKDKRLEHWAWQPLRPSSPDAQIDQFLERKLAEHQLAFSPPADRRTLIRRAYFDVIGLPPSPEELNRHLLNQSPQWYEQLVDELLASPRFGEKWARHWLDVVRFAESDGFEMNRHRPNAWPYRDYVIAAFNNDKPYDQFIREQLAGDALNVDAATGFLVGGPVDRVKSPDPVLTANQRADELHDIVSTTAATFLGLTLNCARCHDHKFDPIPATDYYGFVALLQGVQHGERLWRERSESALPDGKNLRPAVVAGANEDRFPPQSARFIRFTITACSTGEPCIDELEVFSSGGDNVAKTATVKVSDTYADGQHPKHQAKFINDGRYGNDRSWISKQNGGGWAQLEFAQPETIERVVWSRDRGSNDGPRFNDRLAIGYQIELSSDGEKWHLVSSSKDRATSAPQGPLVYSGNFLAPGPTHRMHRGDPTQPREAISPTTLSRIGQSLALPAETPDPARRMALANWIAAPQNPLTARVIVNRLWHYHFGTGLVDTPSDFGWNGSRPTHPDLLDYLAHQLISHQWSLKHVHKLILLSRAFQQSSAMNVAAHRIDSDSRLLWRFPPRRLDAEAIRDAMLATSGQLDLKMGGPGFDLFEPNDNYVKVYVTKAQYGPAEFRRMVYQSKPRTMLDDFFGAFDCPDAGQPQPKRTASTTPLQALNLLNSHFALQQADFLAQRLQREAATPAAQVARACEILFHRTLDEQEQAEAVAFVAEHGLAAYCRALYNSNEFIRLD
jgi:hypothetical protein